MTGLTTMSEGYKPFRYPMAYEFWKRQQHTHWIPEEVPMANDILDFNKKLTPSEVNLLTHIFRFFTQADVEVNDNYMDNYSRVFKPVEVRMMLSAFSNMETIHVAAYSLLLESIGMPEVEYSAFMSYKEMKDKHDYLQNFKAETPTEVAENMAIFGAFTEGLQLFASFAILMNFPRFNKMKGMGQIVTWSVRDESLHCEGVLWLYHEWLKEHPEIDRTALNLRLVEACRRIVLNEDAFVDLVFEMGDVEGMTALDIKNYIRYIADLRLGQLGIAPIYGITKHPIPWLTEILNGVEHANFFEARSTEYSKGATSGSWSEVWKEMDVKNRNKEEAK